MLTFLSHFVFSRSQRNSILSLLFVILALLAVYFFLDTSEEDPVSFSNPEIDLILKQLDSLRCAEAEKHKPKQYPFNPNFITDYKAYTLGLTVEEFDRLQQYREKGEWINSVADFKKVTRVSDSVLNRISPLFTFPDWVTKPGTYRPAFRKTISELPQEKKADLNAATAEQLQEVKGLGVTLSQRIVRYRERIGGFSNELQLYEVYGLSDSVVQRTLRLFTVKLPKDIKKMNLNTISASDIATIPGVSFELAKKIWEYRILHEKIEHISELEKIEGMTPQKLQLFQLYLSFE